MRINGQALKAIRERSGLSQSALAELAGITQGRISEWESDSPPVRPATIAKVAEALVVPVTALLRAEAEVAS